MYTGMLKGCHGLMCLRCVCDVCCDVFAMCINVFAIWLRCVCDVFAMCINVVAICRVTDCMLCDV